jgi:hypothetical protein
MEWSILQHFFPRTPYWLIRASAPSIAGALPKYAIHYGVERSRLLVALLLWQTESMLGLAIEAPCENTTNLKNPEPDPVRIQGA